MQQKVIDFTNLLRKSGIRVSVAEGIDAFQALDELSIADREIFKDALRTSMVKRGDEIPPTTSSSISSGRASTTA